MSEVRVRGSMVSFGTSAKTGDSKSIQQMRRIIHIKK
jgi:hypothetical protein